MQSIFPRSLGAALVLGAAGLLASCGSADTFQALQPSRVVSFGDSLSDLGQVSGKRWTVNGVASNIWTETVAANYGLSIGTASGSLAVGYACVTATGAALGQPCSTTSVTGQIDTFLAAQSFATKDLVLIQGGANDVFTQVGLLAAGAQTQVVADTVIDTAAAALAAQVKRLVAAGALQVGLINLPDMGKTPYATATGQAALLTAATRRFNDRLKVDLVDFGATVYLVDLERYFNGVMSNASYNNTTVVCNNSSGKADDCDTSTILSGANIAAYVFADTVHPTPVIHQSFGAEVYNQLRNRF